MDLIRAILLKLGERQHPVPDETFTMEGYAPRVVYGHLKMLYQKGYVKGGIAREEDVEAEGFRAAGLHLSWEGHELLANIRNDIVWNETKAKIAKTSGTASMEIVEEIAKAIATASITKYDRILLEDEQKELLQMLVEAVRNVPRDQREKFKVTKSSRGTILLHPGLAQNTQVYMGDVEVLASADLITTSFVSQHTTALDVTPLGFSYYGYLKQAADEPVDQVEQEVRSFLEAAPFRNKYPQAYAKWHDAVQRLWESQPERELTTIGHLCREALQEFADVLVQTLKVKTEAGKAQTINRIKAVIAQAKSHTGKTRKAFLEALIEYWERVNDLVQRLEHGGQREGEALRWEDARLVVFQTLLVMYEIDRGVNR